MRRKGILSNQRGFTLLEMLIVISIAGVLAAVAVPRFTNSIALANTARIQSDLQVLNSAIVLYQAEKGEWPTKIEQLSEYVINIEGVKPPKGDFKTRDGKTLTVKKGSYEIDSSKSGQVQASCEGKILSEIGRAETQSE